MQYECRHSMQREVNGAIHFYDCDRKAGHDPESVHYDGYAHVMWRVVSGERYGPETARWYSFGGENAIVYERQEVTDDGTAGADQLP